MRPFKPPAFVQRPAKAAPTPSVEPPAKRRRISPPTASEETETGQSLPATSQASNAPRKALVVVKNPVATSAAATPASDGNEGYYMVLWRKFTAKKHKTWDGDGVLSVYGGYAHLQNESGKELGKTPWNKPLLPGSTLSVGRKDVEVDSMIAKQDFLAGKPFLGGAKPLPTSALPEVQPKQQQSFKSLVKQARVESKQVSDVNKRASASKATSSQFRNPVLEKTTVPKVEAGKPIPRHDPNAPDALVMKRPESAPQGKQIVDVVVDPTINRHLREHQREGVKFMYECIMGMRCEGEGAILADEMGLGKTLQTIALLWTLLKQNPIYGEAPVIKKALVVCPVSLIENWRKEFRKWLGNERIGVFSADSSNIRMTDFTKGKAYSVMVIGYEKLRTVQEDLKQGSGIDIVIADEGHRLKSKENKSAAAIRSLSTERRIILSGTPMQNDLSEFFVMVDFVNPGLLNKYSTFKREFENPIDKSRQPEASAKDVEKGRCRGEELASLTSQFILRRTADILAKYLPPKTEYVLLCKPTVAQTAVYKTITSSSMFGNALRNSDMALQLITILKKVCNSPSLLKAKTEDQKPSETLKDLLSGLTSSQLSPAVSSKIRVLDSLLQRLRATTNEKVVIVSNYTSTLDILGKLLTANDYKFQRLDGTTPSSKRQGLVDRFNKSPPTVCFAFLLSAKSGGVGLNLIGASRLILFDIDWNPATDAQAMARIHRDGQTKPCRIYRMITKGAMDEKIYQRQLTKQGLADAVVDNKANTSAFTKDELRDLFTLDEREECQTHSLLCCQCDGHGNLEGLANAGDKPVSVEDDGSAEGEEEDDDESLPDLAMLQKSSEVDMDKQEEQIKEQARVDKAKAGKSKMGALMHYLHIDTRKIISQTDSEGGMPTTEDLIDDEVLLHVLKEEDSRVNFVFAKTAKR